MEKLHIRKATTDDLPAMQTLAREAISTSYRAYLGDKLVDWFIESGGIDEEITEKLDYCEVLLTQDTIIAFAICAQQTIQLMMVDPAFQRQGYGSSLLAHCEAALFKSGVGKLLVETFMNNKQAVDFFVKNNWQIVRQDSSVAFGFTKVYLEKTEKNIPH